MLNYIFNNSPSYYFPTSGITNLKSKSYTKYFEDKSIIFFNILKKYKLKYAVFAGTSIGYVRNRSNIPWCDDYDIIIFPNQLKLFYKKIVPTLKINGFGGHNYYKKKKKKRRLAGYQVTGKESSFLVDVFFSYINRRGILKNINGWGKYNKKNLKKKDVLPFKKRSFQGGKLRLPFFKNIKKEVYKTYGDVINNTNVHIGHSKTRNIHQKWYKVYAFFNKKKLTALNNTIRIIYVNKNYVPTNSLDVKVPMNNKFDILKNISRDNIGIINIYNNSFLKYCQDIKYYFPKIKINLYLNKVDYNIIFYLNYVNNVICTHKIILGFYNLKVLVYKNKPRFSISS